MHKRVAVLIALLLTILAAAGGLFAWRLLDKTEYETAVATMPGATLRATYTDWAQVRSTLDATGLGAGSSTRDVSEFLDRAYDADLLSTSAVSGSTYAMASRYGFSPLDAAWEMYGQAREGAVVVMKLPESADFAGVERNLRTLGYDEPAAGAGEVGVWAGSVDLVAQIDPSLTPVMQNVVVLEDEQVVLFSDNAAYAASAADVVGGSAKSLAEETDGVRDLAELAGEPVSAVLFASDFACEALSMATADEEDQAAAEDLISEAGGVSPLAGVVMAHQRDRSLVVAMSFENSAQAEENLRPRVDLASGEAVGQGGLFADRFDIATARQTGDSVVLDLRPVGSAQDQAESTLLSDLSQGPVLFATC